MNGCQAEILEREYCLISLIIPIYNEAAHIEKFLQKIDDLTINFAEIELILIDDGSDDGSDSILSRFPFRQRHKTIFNSKNMGKGSCVRKGIEVASGDFIGVQDCDFELDFDDISSLLSPIIEGKADIVLGNRFHHKSAQENYPLPCRFANMILTFLSNLCSGQKFSDVSCCYKFFPAKVIKEINVTSKRFGIDVELVAKISNMHDVRIIELPVAYYPRTYSEGKKITYVDAISIVCQIIYYNIIARFSKKTCHKNQSK